MLIMSVNSVKKNPGDSFCVDLRNKHETEIGEKRDDFLILAGVKNIL